jgi:MoxR-like ATPase
MPATKQALADKARTKLNELEVMLCDWFVERDDVALTICDAMAAQMNHLQVSEPGMGKSAIVRAAYQAVVDATSFEKQVGEQTPLDEVLGGPSIKALKEKDETVRNIAGRIADCHFGFLDEIFKANDTLRSPLLGIINEGLYTNGTTVVECPLRVLFGASNELPKPNDAFLARYAYRHFVTQITERSNFLKFVHQVRDKDAPDTASIGLTLKELDAAYEAVRKVKWKTEADETFWAIREAFRREGLLFNDRTAGWIASRVVPARAWRRGSDVVQAEDFTVLEHCLWITPKDIPKVRELIYKVANPTLEEARKAIDDATQAYNIAKEAVANNSNNKDDAYVDCKAKLDKLDNDLRKRVAETSGSAQATLADAHKKVVDIAIKNATEHGDFSRSVLEGIAAQSQIVSEEIANARLQNA